MNLWQEFLQPTSVSEAIEYLHNAPAPVFPIAGGTDLLLDIKQGRHSPATTLVDMTSIPELNAIEVRGDELFIGAAVPVNRIVEHPLVNEHAQALVEACQLIAGPQVRNTASLGGNVAHALPAADGTIALVCLDAQTEIAGQTGLYRKPFIELFVGPGKSAIDKSTEILVGFYVNLLEPGQASCFKRIMRPQGVALPILNCAVWIHRDQESVLDCRFSVGPGGPTPFRASEAETIIRGKRVNDDVLSEVFQCVLSQAKFRTSPQRATADYRKHIVVDLFKNTFLTAWIRAAN